ncbi:hypothetical protein [Alkalicoccus daliensis]|uniref:Uncharacterized protein n=1 Tax=Alkalicoccus daliensis TaxID=745820 RepID=A0A1H0APP4_9BACI|nr:hypothetical protein [Alkalicoccus daliensis]SDN35043.1 hypothetical protein SAMN04488053_101557 [Alkalicoccus daliensis]
MNYDVRQQVNWGIRIYAAAILLFSLMYIGYYLYISFTWGLRQGGLSLLVSDGIFLLFLPIAAALFYFKPAGWWLNMIVFTYLLISKIVAVAANIFLLQAGLIVDQEGGMNFAIETFYIVLYLAILILFLWKPVREALNVYLERLRISAFWRIFPAALVIYALQFYAAIIFLN